MRTLAFLEKTFLENVREWKILSLTLVFAPFFVFLMHAYFQAAPTSYSVLVRVADAGTAGEQGAARGLVDAWKNAKHADASPVFQVTEVADLSAAEKRVRNREADLLVEIPPGFSAAFRAMAFDRTAVTPAITHHANASNPRSTIAMGFADYLAFQFAYEATGARPPIGVNAVMIGTARQVTDFDLYVPALLVLALIMVMFTAAATLVKEVDKGTMPRLILSRLRLGELLTAVSINQVLIGTVTLLLTYGAALSVGYRPQGPLAAVIVVGAVSTLSVVAIGVLTAAFLKTIFELLTVGCFPFFVLMFFSDCMIPLPKIPLVEVAGFTFNVTDILPTSLTVRAFNRILNQGGGLPDVGVELGLIIALTAIYFTAGAWLYRARHMRAR
jgi:ABC-2 type transport system permease protein